jgi:hypothetical protein
VTLDARETSSVTFPMPTMVDVTLDDRRGVEMYVARPAAGLHVDGVGRRPTTPAPPPLTFQAARYAVAVASSALPGIASMPGSPASSS